ncbi:hypothetical protein B5C26_04570 [Photorhabdus luminescens]|nr:hypothetical protein B5C26_04570 [Photorhabdus luminescens]
MLIDMYFLWLFNFKYDRSGIMNRVIFIAWDKWIGFIFNAGFLRHPLQGEEDVRAEFCFITKSEGGLQVSSV